MTPPDHHPNPGDRFDLMVDGAGPTDRAGGFWPGVSIGVSVRASFHVAPMKALSILTVVMQSGTGRPASLRLHDDARCLAKKHRRSVCLRMRQFGLHCSGPYGTVPTVS